MWTKHCVFLFVAGAFHSGTFCNDMYRLPEVGSEPPNHVQFIRAQYEPQPAHNRRKIINIMFANEKKLHETHSRFALSSAAEKKKRNTKYNAVITSWASTSAYIVGSGYMRMRNVYIRLDNFIMHFSCIVYIFVKFIFYEIMDLRQRSIKFITITTAYDDVLQ